MALKAAPPHSGVKLQKVAPSQIQSQSTANKITKQTTLTKDRVDRTSFSSIKELDSGIAQTFTTSKTSSYLRNQYSDTASESEEAVGDEFSVGSRTPELEMVGMLTNPHSFLQPLVCPCDGFKGWKGINLGGRVASKSFSDLKALRRWEWSLPKQDPAQMEIVLDEPRQKKMVDGSYSPGNSPLELLPMELLSQIIDQLATDIPPGGITARNIDLMSLLLTSHSMHAATLSTLYAQITIPHSRIFAKFLSQITERTSLGSIVRRLDFSHYNPRCAGMTARERAETRNLIPETILKCLDFTPNLKEFLATEHIEDDLDVNVMEKLFCGLDKLKAIDFCACSSEKFKKSLRSVIRADSPVLPSVLPIARLSLHECAILDSSVYEILLPRLPHLTHLDVAHTRITDEALYSIPPTAQLTHLNLSKCSFLTGEAVVDFLTNHPAAKSLVYLNLAMDVKSHEMLSSEDITAILPILPKTLRSLNLKGSKMGKEHIELLLPLTKHLEELGLGRPLELKDLVRLFVPDQGAPIEQQLAWVPHSLRYLDVSDLSPAQLDLGTLFGMCCPVLNSVAHPIEVLEVGKDVWKRLERAEAVLKRVGWTTKEAGRRYWLVRVKREGEDGFEDKGGREWKWGATFWGMRKVAVARAEVGGMYGHYMFKM